ncbi:hypothetical protein L227DRAFT_601836 [Lentinus tigrinus ALCF2SS1-6]|uniref:Uncharacterized protein n=1 Tax=Lentinus tigrinus ALCF2SS1-6 TaxID=1328759 RepID=A0A5C2S5Q9_9APHY|nr:hypothetical protein L227DRAFT_601836 [Lentinus tigrinus ALCF2SS1-6]
MRPETHEVSRTSQQHVRSRHVALDISQEPQEPRKAVRIAADNPLDAAVQPNGATDQLETGAPLHQTALDAVPRPHTIPPSFDIRSPSLSSPPSRLPLCMPGRTIAPSGLTHEMTGGRATSHIVAALTGTKFAPGWAVRCARTAWFSPGQAEPRHANPVRVAAAHRTPTKGLKEHMCKTWIHMLEPAIWYSFTGSDERLGTLQNPRHSLGLGHAFGNWQSNLHNHASTNTGRCTSPRAKSSTPDMSPFEQQITFSQIASSNATASRPSSRVNPSRQTHHVGTISYC